MARSLTSLTRVQLALEEELSEARSDGDEAREAALIDEIDALAYEWADARAYAEGYAAHYADLKRKERAGY